MQGQPGEIAQWQNAEARRRWRFESSSLHQDDMNMDAELKERFDRIETLALLGAKNVLTIKDVALLLGKSPRTIRNIVDELPHYRNGHGIWFKKSEIEAWQCQIKHTAMRI